MKEYNKPNESKIPKGCEWIKVVIVPDDVVTFSLSKADREHREFLNNIEINNTNWLANCAEPISFDDAILENLSQGTSLQEGVSTLKPF